MTNTVAGQLDLRFKLVFGRSHDFFNDLFVRNALAAINLIDCLSNRGFLLRRQWRQFRSECVFELFGGEFSHWASGLRRHRFQAGIDFIGDIQLNVFHGARIAQTGHTA